MLIPHHRAQDARGRWPLIAGCLLLSAVVLAHAGLLGRSHWHADEYITLARIKQFGRPFLLQWYLHWSPRLWPDLLFTVYAAAVDRLHRPLAGSCMAMLWAGLAASCIWPALRGGSGPRLPRIFIGLAVLCLFLVGHGINEVFFWPAGGLSYMPTLAGIAWLFWCVVDGVAGRVRMAALAALLLTAGSSEVGIFFALAFCGCTLAWSLSRLGWRQSASLWWLLPGFSLAILDLALVLHGRVGVVEILGTDNHYVHHAGASLRGAVPRFAAQLAGLQDADAGTWIAARHLGAWCLVVLGARHWQSSRIASDGLLLPFAVSLVLAAFASVAAALYQFGLLCCERHDTMRDCFLALALVSLGLWSSQIAPPRVVRAGRAAGLVAPMLAGVLILFTPRLPLLPGEYRLYPGAASARALTWSSGLQPGPEMTLVHEPASPLLSTEGLATGVFRLDKNVPWPELGVLEFFGKTTLVVAAPSLRATMQ